MSQTMSLAAQEPKLEDVTLSFHESCSSRENEGVAFSQRLTGQREHAAQADSMCSDGRGSRPAGRRGR